MGQSAPQEPVDIAMRPSDLSLDSSGTLGLEPRALQHVVMQGPQQIRSGNDSNNLGRFNDRHEALVPLKHGHFHVVKRHLRLCRKCISLHNLPHRHVPKPMKESLLNQLSADKTGIVLLFVHDRKDIESVGRHSLPGFSDSSISINRFHRASHDILSQERRTIVSGQQLDQFLLHLRQGLSFHRRGGCHGMTSAPEFSRDPSHVDFGPTASPDHFHPIVHHHRREDGIDSLQIRKGMHDASRFPTAAVDRAGRHQHLAALQIMHVAMLQEIVQQRDGVRIKGTAQRIRYYIQIRPGRDENRASLEVPAGCGGELERSGFFIEA